MPINRQAELVGLNRGDVNYLPSAVSAAEQRLTRRIDALNLAYPFAGSPMLRNMLAREGLEVGQVCATGITDIPMACGWVCRSAWMGVVPGARRSISTPTIR